MVKYKLLPFRHLLTLFPIIFTGIIYNGAITHILFFDPNAPDLIGLDGYQIKQDYFLSMLSINNSLYEYGFFQSFLFPLLMVWMGYSYYFIKNRYLKHMIGKAGDYHYQIFCLKSYMGGIVVSIFSVLLLVIVLIGVLIGRTEYPQLEMYFNMTSPLSIFASNVWLYLFYYFLVKVVALFVQTCFVCYLVDYYANFTKAALFYLFIMWGMAPILYSFVPFYLVPMSNLMITTYADISMWQISLTYLPFLVIYALLKARKPYEVG